MRARAHTHTHTHTHKHTHTHTSHVVFNRVTVEFINPKTMPKNELRLFALLQLNTDRERGNSHEKGTRITNSKTPTSTGRNNMVIW